MKKRSFLTSKPSKPAMNLSSIHELEKFTTTNLERWQMLSQEFDHLADILYFNLEPERRKFRQDLIKALQSHPRKSLQLDHWVRIINYQFSDEPLSSAGSLQSIGGRFNAGIDLEPNTLDPWPAFYLAADYETAYREKFQCKKDEKIDGLTPEELSLNTNISYTTIFLNGFVNNIFDMTTVDFLNPVANVLKKIKAPESAVKIFKKLYGKNNDLCMIKTSKQLYETIFNKNWRINPIQFGLPAESQIIAELIRAAGFEGILYLSTKNSEKCLAIFPDCLADGSFVELAHRAPKNIKHKKLSFENAESLAGWESISAKRQKF